MSRERGMPRPFRTMADVVNLQENTLKAISGQSTFDFNSGESLSNFIIEKEINDLKDLIEDYKAVEADFYAKNGFTGPEPYKSLKKKVDEWNSSGASAMLQDDSLIDSIVGVFDAAKYADFGEVVSAFSENAINNKLGLLEDEDLKKELGWAYEAGASVIAGGLKGGFTKGDKSRKGTIFIELSGVKGDLGDLGAGEFKKLTNSNKGITIYRRKNSDTIQIRFTQDISRKTQERLTKEFKHAVEEAGISVNGSTKADICAQITEKVLARLPRGEGIKDVAYNKIYDTMNAYLVDKQEINVSRSRSVIRGMLGEVYWNAFFRFLGTNHYPVGLNVESIAGKEIPVDIALGAFGAQVKNYKEAEGIVTFNQHFEKETQEMVPNELSLHSFLSYKNFMAESDELIFGNFWFSESYNKRNERLDVNNVYTPVEKNFKPIESGIETYFKSSLKKLLNLDKDVLLKTPELFDEHFEAGKPTFFIINDKLFPTSYILYQILKSLEDGDTEKYITLNPTTFSLDLSGFNVGNTYPKRENPDIGGRLKRGKITYTIDVNVSKMVQNILNVTY